MVKRYCIRCDEKLPKNFRKGSECPACGVTLHRFVTLKKYRSGD